MKKKILKRVLAVAVVSAVLAIGGNIANLKLKQASAGYPCYDPNIVHCGAASKQDLVSAMNGTDQAGHRDIKDIFDRIGIYEKDILSARVVDGTVRKSDGAVIVGGQVVATNTVNGQRGSYGIQGPHTSWIGLEWAHPSANFRADSLDVWVYMVNGQFKYAIIKACGNPVLVPPLQEIPTRITIKKEVMNITSDKVWKKSNEAKPTNALGYLLTLQNTSDVSVREVVVKDILPGHMDLIPGTGKLIINNNQEIDIPDRAIAGGYNLGILSPGQVVYIKFATRLKDDFPGGCTNLINTGIAKGGNTEQVQDTASTLVCIVTPQAKYNITVKKFNDINGDGKKQENEEMLPNWKFTLTGSKVTDTRTTDASGSISYINLDAGTYAVAEEMQPGWRATTSASQNATVGPDATLWFGNQRVEVPPTPPAQPTQLPVSGPVEAAAGVMGTGALGYAGYMWRRSKIKLMSTLKEVE